MHIPTKYTSKCCHCSTFIWIAVRAHLKPAPLGKGSLGLGSCQSSFLLAYGTQLLSLLLFCLTHLWKGLRGGEGRRGQGRSRAGEQAMQR